MSRKKNVLTTIYLFKAIEFVTAQINLLRWQIQRGSTVVTTPKTKRLSKTDAHWTGAIAEIVEFIYGAMELKIFNDGDIFLKELTDSLCEKFGFEVKDCYGAYTEMRKRVGKSRTLFLDRMVKALNEKMDRDDEKEHNRKRK